MKIIHIPRRFVREEWGGTETVVLNYCKSLASFGVQSAVETSLALSDSAEECIERVPVVRHRYTYPYVGLSSEQRSAMDLKGGNLFSSGLLRSLIRQEFSLLHLHTLKRMGGIGRTAARLKGKPYVVSLHGGVFAVPRSEEESFAAVSRETLEWGKVLGALVGSRRVLEDAAAIICLNKGEKNLVEERYPGVRSVLLPNGVDLSRFEEGNGTAFRVRYGIDKNATHVLSVARIDPQKNQLTLLRAVRKVVSEGAKVHLTLIGAVSNPGYLTQLENFIVEANLHHYVTIIPGLDPGDKTLVNAYHSADIFSLVSVHEPFGIVVLEAWAAGIPVVASRVGGLADLIEDGENGLLLEPEDAIGLAQSWNQVISDAEFRKNLIHNAKRQVQNQYSWDAVTRNLIGIYQEVLYEHSYCESKRWFLRWC